MGHLLTVAPNTDKQIDELYGGRLEDFVNRRDELARALRTSGDPKAADELTSMRKPTVAAWAVNQLARREKMQLRSLLTAGERLRKAHEDLLGGGSPAGLQQARDDERKAIAGLARAAGAILEEAGHPANEPTLDRIRDTLHAAAVDEDLAGRLREGRLDREQDAAEFGFDTLPASPPAPKRRDQLDKRKTERKETAKARLHEAEQRLGEARQAVSEAEQIVRERQKALARAERELGGRQAEAARAEREADRARKAKAKAG